MNQSNISHIRSIELSQSPKQMAPKILHELSAPAFDMLASSKRVSENE
jgi:hypothetical protein